MAQTLTTLRTASPVQYGGAAGSGALRFVAVNVANGAGELSIAVDWSTYGLTSVVLWGFCPRDTHTDAGGAVKFADLSGTTVTYNWAVNDVANVLVWAAGY